MSEKDDLIEKLANIEHQRWSDWQAWLHSKGHRLSRADPSYPGHLLIQGADVEHWEELMHTEYYALPEHSKQADRDQVMRYWSLIVEFVASWIEDDGRNSRDSIARAARWLEQMR